MKTWSKNVIKWAKKDLSDDISVPNIHIKPEVEPENVQMKTAKKTAERQIITCDYENFHKFPVKILQQ